MNNENELINRIADDLNKKLPKQFIVTPTYITSGSAAIPDISVIEKNSNQVIFIEVKGSASTDDLPMATLPYLKRMQEISSDAYENKPNIILVSISEVPELLEIKFQKNGIDVIKVNETKDISGDIVNLINKKHKKLINKPQNNKGYDSRKAPTTNFIRKVP
jgi:hypothetical protein